jgi:TldD protein
VHSGVWGFASSPIVTEDEIKRITRVAVEVAKASAIAKKADLKLAQVPKYVENYVTPMTKAPLSVSQTDKQAWAQAIVDKAKGVKGVTAINVTASHNYEWRYFASSEGSYIEQELYTTSPNLTITAKVGDVTRTRNYIGVASMGGWEVAEATDFLASAERVANEAVEMCTAKPLGSSGLRDLILSPSHAMLTIHEIVAHATEVDRIVGYEANYAGTSFVKISDIGKLKYGSKLMNITADKTDNGLGSYAYDDDGVKATKFPIVREGKLVGLQTNRETAHLVGENFSRGCTFANSWRDYPFLRMPNVHLEPGPDNSPKRDELIADVKNGVMIDGARSAPRRRLTPFEEREHWTPHRGELAGEATNSAPQHFGLRQVALLREPGEQLGVVGREIDLYGLTNPARWRFFPWHTCKLGCYYMYRKSCMLRVLGNPPTSARIRTIRDHKC